jgi:hypothetical protein
MTAINLVLPVSRRDTGGRGRLRTNPHENGHAGFGMLSRDQRATKSNAFDFLSCETGAGPRLPVDAGCERKKRKGAGR